MKKIFPAKDTRCCECIWAKWHKGTCILASGFICKINPLKPIFMGLDGKHLDREQREP